MFGRWKSEASSAIRLFALAGACAGAAAIALGFISAAAFVAALRRYGLVEACLVGAGVYLVAALLLLAVYAELAAHRRREELKRAAAEKGSSPLADPRLVLLGLQIAQAIGMRRLLPILALGAVALALGSSLRARVDAPAGEWRQ